MKAELGAYKYPQGDGTHQQIRDKYYRCLRDWISSHSKNKDRPGKALVDRQLEGWETR